ncbi:MAG: ammonium transporter [Aerococcaceae bacterium]|nr:ammonium transporter [Aerococcaceae bacterium]
MFILVCIFVMWLMIFGVASVYYSMVVERAHAHLLLVFVLSLFVGSIVWFNGAYSLAFGNRWLWLANLQTIDLEELLNMMFQLCFALYAIVMLIGSVIDRVKLKGILLLVGGWTVLVYAPLAHLFWHPNGWLQQIGALDFSGGMVVHLSAGLSCYILAHAIPSSCPKITYFNMKWLFIGVLFITLGWFGFNAGPVGELNQHAMLVIINTLLAIIAGGFSWFIAHLILNQEQSIAALLNGMVVGLVTSTSSVGYVKPWQLIIIVTVASFITCWIIDRLLSKCPIDDVVDSFGMNGVGGLLGSIGTVCFIPSALYGQTIGILVTVLLSSIVTFTLTKVLKPYL